MIDPPTQHPAVTPAQRCSALRARAQTAVDGDPKPREVLLEPAHDFEAQRRDFTVLARRQSAQYRLARMHDEMTAAGLRDLADEIAQVLIVLLVEAAELRVSIRSGSDADAQLHAHRHAHRGAHRSDAFGHTLGCAHEASAEGAGRHALARTAAIEI